MLHHVAFPFFMATTCYKPYDHLTFPVVWFSNDSNDAFFEEKKKDTQSCDSFHLPGGNAWSSASGIAWNTSPDVERRNVESIRCRAGRVGSGCLVVCIDACPNAPHCRLLISPETSGWNKGTFCQPKWQCLTGKNDDEPLDFSAGINKVDLWSSDQQRETNRQNLNYSNKNCSSYFESSPLTNTHK